MKYFMIFIVLILYIEKNLLQKILSIDSEIDIFNLIIPLKLKVFFNFICNNGDNNCENYYFEWLKKYYINCNYSLLPELVLYYIFRLDTCYM